MKGKTANRKNKASNVKNKNPITIIDWVSGYNTNLVTYPDGTTENVCKKNFEKKFVLREQQKNTNQDSKQDKNPDSDIPRTAQEIYAQAKTTGTKFIKYNKKYIPVGLTLGQFRELTGENRLNTYLSCCANKKTPRKTYNQVKKFLSQQDKLFINDDNKAKIPKSQKPQKPTNQQDSYISMINNVKKMDTVTILKFQQDILGIVNDRIRN